MAPATQAFQISHDVQVEPDSDRWGRVDEHLYCGERLRAVVVARDDFGLSLPEAIEAIGARWETLKSAFPERFRVPLDGYWDGFYS